MAAPEIWFKPFDSIVLRVTTYAGRVQFLDFEEVAVAQLNLLDRLDFGILAVAFPANLHMLNAGVSFPFLLQSEYVLQTF